MSNGYLAAAAADISAAAEIGAGFGLDLVDASALTDPVAAGATFADAANVGLILSQASAVDPAFRALLEVLAQVLARAQLILVEPEARAAFAFLPVDWPAMSLQEARMRAQALSPAPAVEQAPPPPELEREPELEAEQQAPIPESIPEEPGPQELGPQEPSPQDLAEPAPPEIAEPTEGELESTPEPAVEEEITADEQANEIQIQAPDSTPDEALADSEPPAPEQAAGEAEIVDKIQETGGELAAEPAPPTEEDGAVELEKIQAEPPAEFEPPAPQHEIEARETPDPDFADAPVEEKADAPAVGGAPAAPTPAQAPAPMAPAPARRRETANAAPADATAFAPKKLRRGEAELVRISIHQPKDLQAVIKAARKADPRTTGAPHSMGIGDIALGANVGVALDVKGAECEGAVQRRAWEGEPLDFAFAVTADANAKQVLIMARVFVGDAQIGVLAFTRAVAGPRPKPLPDGDRARLKRHKYVFLSYSSQDREIVAAIATAYQRAGVKHFWDRASLKSGEEWSPRLRREIEACDLFHLCWSKAAAGSEWVEKEASCAIGLSRRKKRPEISVQMLDGPPWAKHPDSLDSINFDDFVRAAIVGYARGE